jgi:tRNA 2-thiouridine synthesizing protein E
MTTSDRYDKEGFLLDHLEWNQNLAHEIAEREGIRLGDAHWEIILLAREFYSRHEHSPEMRPLVKFTRLELGDDKGNSIYLLGLFPDSPAKLVSKIAGLPRPTNCL